GAMSFKTAGMSFKTGAMNVHPGAMSFKTAGMSFKTGAVNVHPGAMNFKTAGMSFKTGAVNVHIGAMSFKTGAINFLLASGSITDKSGKVDIPASWTRGETAKPVADSKCQVGNKIRAARVIEQSKQSAECRMFPIRAARVIERSKSSIFHTLSMCGGFWYNHWEAGQF
ncbi:MAG: hypothetical protein FWH27_12250, partial [Planctomycetaceae bacterium]|nr:hypothetical protein [Planctomycetaceae bacterium]